MDEIDELRRKIKQGELELSEGPPVENLDERTYANVTITTEEVVPEREEEGKYEEIIKAVNKREEEPSINLWPVIKVFAFVSFGILNFWLLSNIINGITEMDTTSLVNQTGILEVMGVIVEADMGGIIFLMMISIMAFSVISAITSHRGDV